MPNLITNDLKKAMRAAYLDRTDNFPTTEKFAEHYGISEQLALLMLDEMAAYHSFVCAASKVELARAILDKAKEIIGSSMGGIEKYEAIFSDEICQAFSRIYPRFTWIDPDQSYDEDISEWYHSAKDFLEL